ncbi:MAG TPA: FAD-dependent oxidoreductase [Chthoniobacterales bacterium]
MNSHYQVIVIGSGSAGKDAALQSGRSGLSTLLVEAGSLGGTCFHRGVHAVRALRACATHFDDTAERSHRLGTSVDLIESGWSDWLGVQRRTSGRLTEELGRALDCAKVEVKFGRARFFGPQELVVKEEPGQRDEVVRAEHIIVATGSRPAYAGLEKAGVLDSDQFLRHTAVPAPRWPRLFLKCPVAG